MMKYTTYLTIETDDARYKLSALYYHKKNKYAMPSIEVPDTVDEDNHWDNDEFILGELLTFLEGKLTPMWTEESEMLKRIPIDDRLDLLKIIKKGIRIGMFDNK